jgi:hypothetical protein
LRSRISAALLLSFIGACGGDDGGSAPGTPPASGDGCAEGFSRDATQPAVCREIVPSADCGPGTAPFIGQKECAPVGWTAPCPEGFVRDPSGWGCADRTPSAACVGPTRESVTSEACVAVGACSGAFPPAGALLVDDDFVVADLDATHFRTIASAVAAAPAGAVVAVAAGRYAESLDLPHAMTIVGRCAEQVTIEAPAAPAPAAAGVRVSGVRGAVVRGVTLVGHKNGVEVVGKSEAAIEDVVVDASIGAGIFVEASDASVHRTKIAGTLLGSDNKWGWGVAAGVGSKVVIDDSTITGGVDGVFALGIGTVVSLDRSVILRQSPSGSNRSSGVSSAVGAKITLARSVVRDVEGDGAVVADDGGLVEVSESILRGTRVQGTYARGHGVSAIFGGKVVIRSSALVDHESITIATQKPNTRVELTDSVIRGPSESHARIDAELRVASDRSGIGVQVLDGSAVVLDGVAIQKAWGYSAYVTGGTLEAHRTFIDDTRGLQTPGTGTEGVLFGVGLVVGGGGKATLTDSTITRGRLAAISVARGGNASATAVLLRGIGESLPYGTGSGISVGEGGTVDFTRGAIDRAAAIGLLAVRGGDASVHVVDSTVHGTLVGSTGFGYGAAAGFGTSFTIEGSYFFNNAAVALALAGGSARVSGTTFSHNLIALHAQDGSFLSESASTGDLATGELRVAPDTKFVDNETKVGSGEIPLPPDPLK